MKYPNILISFLIFISGLVFGRFLIIDSNASGNKLAQMKTSFECREKFKLISQTNCRDLSKKKVALDKSLKALANAFVATSVQNHDAEAVSVEFRSLETGRWFSLNEDALYSPASLLKVPKMLAYLKYAETHPEILSLKIVYDGDASIVDNSSYKPANPLEKGKEYTVEQLIKSMIGQSDNVAAGLLGKYLPPALIAAVYDDFGVTFPADAGASITVEDYSYFLRRLYFIRYLNREMSEKALELLAIKDFNEGIAAVLPQGTVVAQKFGERSFYDANDSEKLIHRELHDCGIVYHPQQPYLLCIMTKGKDFKKLAEIIQGISRIVYQEIKTRPPETQVASAVKFTPASSKSN